MRHSLTDRDTEARTATCSVDGAVSIRKSGTGWVCAEKAKANVRAYQRRHPDRDRSSKTEHTLTWKAPQLRQGACAKCGPVDIVPVGRGWGCRVRQIELGRLNHQGKPATYCDACKILDGDVVWLTADGCPRCNETDLNAMLAAKAADDRLLGGINWGKAGMSVAGVTDPYDMPDLENAVPGWRTLG